MHVAWERVEDLHSLADREVPYSIYRRRSLYMEGLKCEGVLRVMETNDLNWVRTMHTCRKLRSMFADIGSAEARPRNIHGSEGGATKQG